MLSFAIDDVLRDLREALVNTELGLEKDSQYFVHDSLVGQYIKYVLAATNDILDEKLKPSSEATERL